MTRHGLLEAIESSGRPRGEALYDILTGIGVDLRPLVCTKSDPWVLVSQVEVEGWIDQHILWDGEDELVRIKLYPRFT